MHCSRRDIAKYNTDDDLEESIEETGWKLVHGDVFRPPQHSRFFAAIIGSGIQLLCMIGITIFFAMLGMLSPASRGALLTAAIFLYEFMGLWAGYYAGRLYKTMKAQFNFQQVRCLKSQICSRPYTMARFKTFLTQLRSHIVL